MRLKQQLNAAHIHTHKHTHSLTISQSKALHNLNWLFIFAIFI